MGDATQLEEPEGEEGAREPPESVDSPGKTETRSENESTEPPDGYIVHPSPDGPGGVHHVGTQVEHLKGGPTVKEDVMRCC